MIIYGSKEAKELPTGMYLGMFHGRDTLDEDMDSWGYSGIIIPVIGYHTTYADEFRIHLPDVTDVQKYFPSHYLSDGWIDLEIVGGCLKYDNKFYGDWTVYFHENEEL